MKNIDIFCYYNVQSTSYNHHQKIEFFFMKKQKWKTQNISKTFQNYKGLFQYTSVTLFVNSMPAQAAVYQFNLGPAQTPWLQLFYKPSYIE